MAFDFFSDIGGKIVDIAEDVIFGEGPRTSGPMFPVTGGAKGEGTAIDINIGFPTETKGSGVNDMEYNGAYNAAGTGLVGLGTSLIRNLPRVLGTGGVGGAVGGALTGYGVGQMMAGNGNSCEVKPFVRFDKCGRPIITRKMQQQAEALVNMAGPEYASQVLGIDLPLLLLIASKKFKSRAKGISGAQLRTAQRVNNKIFHMHDKLVAACKAPTRRAAPRRKM
jgi:hypothetical protein